MTLATDITRMLEGIDPKHPIVGNPEIYANAAIHMAWHTSNPLRTHKETGPGRLSDKVLWASELGERCNRKLWYKFHTPAEAEPMSGPTKFKLAYGNIIEEMALVYAQAAGWEVTHQQHLLVEVLDNGWTVRGRIDAAMQKEGWAGAPRTLLDVKSCSSHAFGNYVRAGHMLNRWNDSFGYIQQMHFYDRNRHQLPTWDELQWVDGEFLFIDKQLGKMHSMGYTPPDPEEAYWTTKGGAHFASVMASPSPPERGYLDRPEAASGNRVLGIACSYCQFKSRCWPDLRAFKYSTGVKFFSHVAKAPKVAEIPLDAASGHTPLPVHVSPTEVLIPDAKAPDPT